MLRKARKIRHTKEARIKISRSILLFAISVVIVLLLLFTSYVSFSLSKEHPATFESPSSSTHSFKGTNLQNENERLSRRKIEFVPTNTLDEDDIFAASWWQSKERFLRLDPEEIKIVEDGVFAALWTAGGAGMEDIGMTRDWLDFSVEHFSKWWRVFPNKQVANYAKEQFLKYVKRTMSAQNLNTKLPNYIMKSTIAIIPYGVAFDKDLFSFEQGTWRASLAATIASLVQHGVGRVVVVGYFDADTRLALDAFYFLLQSHTQTTRQRPHIHFTLDRQSFSTSVASTELAYVHTNDVNSTYIPVNLPKAVIKGLQLAFQGKQREQWLGTNPDRYKYIFLTEADQILSARLTVDFLDAMDNGKLIVPYRLQPIPHSLDLEGVLPEELKSLLPRDDKYVYELTGDDSCCDTTDKTGEKGFEDCGSFWFECGFEVTKGDHVRLESYNFIRIKGGSGIVNLASSEHSRKCTPVEIRHQGFRAC